MHKHLKNSLRTFFFMILILSSQGIKLWTKTHVNLKVFKTILECFSFDWVYFKSKFLTGYIESWNWTLKKLKYYQYQKTYSLSQPEKNKKYLAWVILSGVILWFSKVSNYLECTDLWQPFSYLVFFGISLY